jgi:hypothetical protein
MFLSTGGGNYYTRGFKGGGDGFSSTNIGWFWSISFFIFNPNKEANPLIFLSTGLG